MNGGTVFRGKAGQRRAAFDIPIVLRTFPTQLRHHQKFQLLLTVLVTMILLPLMGLAARPVPERSLAAQWLQKMTLPEKVAQLIVVPCYGDNPSIRSKQFRNYRNWVRSLGVGGFIVVNRVVRGSVQSAEPYAMAAFLNRMQKLSKLPLLVASDFERGASMRVDNTVKFPHAMAYAAAGDPGATRWLASFTAEEARAMGVHWILVPDADVNNNPDNPIINIRSYGENPQMVSRHVRAFIEGAHLDPKFRVMTSAKHFPGHGDTAIDSHIGLPRLDVTRERLDRLELVPFREAISAGTDSIMSAHIALPALDPSGVPATISKPVLTGLLRKDMAFKGIIVTDAMDMKALAQQFGPGEVSVRAVEAGADVLLMPASPEEAVRAILAAIRSGRLTRHRIEESAMRILAAKVRLGLARRRTVDVESINDVIDSPEAEAQAQSVADRAVTLVKNESAAVPLASPGNTCFVVLAESRYSRHGVVLLDEVRKRAPEALTIALEAAAPDAIIDQTIHKTAACGQVVVAAFSSAAAYKGTIALGGGFPRLLGELTKGRPPVTLVAMGNPYLLRDFPDVAAYLATFSTVPPSEVAAVKALFGEIPIQGRMPVSIPGLVAYGDGITIAAGTVH